MKDWGPTSSYFGIQITRDWKNRWIWIDQQAYIENAIKRFRLQDANNTKTPLPAAIHLEKYDKTATTETKTLFQQMIGTLIYAAIGTRPDIAFTATQLSWYNNNPSDSHVKYAKHILRYLWGTKELQIKYHRGSNAGIIRYSDLHWGENRDNHHSMSFWWQMDASLGHHNDKRLLHFQWEKLNTWNLQTQVAKLPGPNPSVGR